MSEKITEFSSYGKDTPVGRPDIDGRAACSCPTRTFDLANSTTIRKGAGIVGFGNPDGSLTIYFEANRFDDSSLHKWEHKARKAYERMVMGAPTVSKAKIDARSSSRSATSTAPASTSSCPTACTSGWSCRTRSTRRRPTRS